MRYEDDCEGLEEDIEGTVVDRVKRLWRRVEDVVKTSNCETKNSRTSEPLALDCLGWDSERLYLLVGDHNSLSNIRSWSKFCDSDRIIPNPSRTASGPWCWVGRPIMFLFDCWLAGCLVSIARLLLVFAGGGSSRPNLNPKQKRRDRFIGTGQWYGLDRWEETRLRWERTSSVVGKTKIKKVEEPVQGCDEI
ncbi:hypothetical protein DY000_02024060 [Brassica cretica]|uniref:Uncharacterized protein n=1 Tax=Brassica cretica TaxID=69181 RepID=A0ABQ7E8L7_BRACR|nr:hypothetical protein DY000_02024060 [Brassica cretica]